MRLVPTLKHVSGLVLATLCCQPVMANPSWQVEVTAGAGYDSNVTVDEIDVTSTVGDQFRLISLTADTEYVPAEGHTLSASYTFSDNKYTDLSRFDLRNQLASLGYRFKFQDITYGLNYRYVDAQLGGDGFLSLRQIAPYVSAFVSKKRFVRLGFTHTSKALDNNVERDASSNELSADFYYFVNGLRQYVIFGLKQKNENAVDRQFDFDSWQLRIGYQKRFKMWGKETILRANWRYRERDFDTLPSEVINEFRLDERHVVDASLEWQLTQKWRIELETAYRNNASNLPTIDFVERNIQLGVTYAY